jgi:hypothetical protein
MIPCFKRKFHIFGGILAVTVVYFVVQIICFIYYSISLQQQSFDFKNVKINPKFNVLNRHNLTGYQDKTEKQGYSNSKTKAQYQIPFIQISNNDIKQPKLFYLLPYHLQRSDFNLTILNVDYLDFNNFETTQTNAFMRGIDKQKANSYLPNAKGFFNCLDSNVTFIFHSKKLLKSFNSLLH